MNILFLTLSQSIINISNRGIYPDLLRKFVKEGQHVFIVCPLERRQKQKTQLKREGNVTTLCVKTLNITKSNIIEKGIGTILIENQYQKAINKFLYDIKFDMVMYSTPPITFNKVIQYVKKKFGSKSYLLLKDIFPQNAVDLGMFSINSPFYWFFRKKEKTLYALSDHIGCMSPANIKYVLKHNPKITKESVEICPNSIEPQTEQEIVDKDSILSKYRIPSNVPVFIYGGNLGKPQGIEFLIEVLKSNANRHDVFFLIAGSGTEYHRLDAWYKKEKPNNVLLLDTIPKDDYDQLSRVCDVGLIFLDKRYTIPNYPSRLLSYLENKMPVVMATDVSTDVGEIAEENGYGLWVESGNLEAFNSKLNYLITNKELLETMGEKGYQYLLDNYTVDTSYDIIMSHFE
jgi:glycosyltransferase involved in cell wall biosynthesis